MPLSSTCISTSWHKRKAEQLWWHWFTYSQLFTEPKRESSAKSVECVEQAPRCVERSDDYRRISTQLLKSLQFVGTPMDVICFDQQRRVEQFLWWIMFDIFVAVDWTYQQKLRIYRWCVSNKCIHSGIILALYSLFGPYYPIECGAAANNLDLITHASALSAHAYWNNMTCSSQFRWAHNDWSRSPLFFFAFHWFASLAILLVFRLLWKDIQNVQWILSIRTTYDR